MAVDGSVLQSAHDINSGDYSYEEAYGLVLGIVLHVHYSDDPVNRTAAFKDDLRGSSVQATVLALNDGIERTWEIPNVTILPSGASGIDDFHEEIPRPCSGVIDGTAYRPDMANMDYSKLNGDWCIVGFIGGHLDQAVMLSWFPHPGNSRDPATSGESEGTKIHGNRLLKRFSGTRFEIDNEGNVLVDTNLSNSEVDTSTGLFRRKKIDEGGNFQIDMKDTSTLEVNFNKPPSRKNPSIGEFTRPETESTFSMDKDFIKAVAGEVVQMLGNKTTDSVLLGENPTDHAILGEKFQELYNDFVDKYNDLVTKHNNHTHTSNGQPPVELFHGDSTSEMSDDKLSEKVKIE